MNTYLPKYLYAIQKIKICRHTLHEILLVLWRGGWEPDSRANARYPLLSKSPEITFPLQRKAANESLPSNKLLNTRFPWQPTGQQRAINCSTWCLLCGQPTRYKSSEVVNSRLYTRVDAGSNTSTVTLRVVEGDEKKSLKSETAKRGHEPQGTWSRERLGQ
jgi:hypothetical protein